MNPERQTNGLSVCAWKGMSHRCLFDVREMFRFFHRRSLFMDSHYLTCATNWYQKRHSCESKTECIAGFYLKCVNESVINCRTFIPSRGEATKGHKLWKAHKLQQCSERRRGVDVRESRASAWLSPEIPDNPKRMPYLSRRARVLFVAQSIHFESEIFPFRL